LCFIETGLLGTKDRCVSVFKDELVVKSQRNVPSAVFGITPLGWSDPYPIEAVENPSLPDLHLLGEIDYSDAFIVDDCSQKVRTTVWLTGLDARAHVSVSAEIKTDAVSVEQLLHDASKGFLLEPTYPAGGWGCHRAMRPGRREIPGATGKPVRV
jgi:hypothetical protein